MTRLPLLAALLSASLAHGGGVTLMTHGFNSDVEGWILPMADRFTDRDDFPGSELTCYIVDVAGTDGAYTTTVSRIGPEPDASDSGEILVKLDWGAISDQNGTNSTDIATVAAQVLLSTTLFPENDGRPLAELPLHLLGHSRGASVVSETARVLGASGVWVDHLTLWDPVDDIYGFGDPVASAWANVLFADNYFQELDILPTGISVAGAYNRELTSLPGGYPGFGFGNNHSDVHAWYHGTVELGTSAFDGNITLSQSIRDAWWTAAESEGADAGFHYSRIAGGDRLSTAEPAGAGLGRIVDGYNQMWDLGAGVSANRSSLPTPVDPWPNLIVARRTTADELQAGDSLPLVVQYQSEVTGVGDPTLTLLLDPDPNPWNGNEIELSSELLTGSGFASVLSATPAPVLPAESTGSFYLLARLTEDGRSRYLGLREPLSIAAAAIPPTIASGSLRLESGLFTFTIDGSPGQSVTVQAATTLDDWQTIDTVVLGSPSEDFSDPDTASFERRFYRVGEAP